jgi:hypothetical protein
MKKLFFCLLVFMACKKEDPKVDARPKIHLTFEEYPSGNRVNELPVKVGFQEQVTLFSYEFHEDLSGITNDQGDFQYFQHPSGQYVKSFSSLYHEFSYHIPGHRYVDQPANYGFPPPYPEAALVKKDGNDRYYKIPVYRKIEATLIVKQVTPSEQFETYTVGGISIFVATPQAFSLADTTPSKYVAVYTAGEPLVVRPGVYIDTSFTIQLYPDFYNCVRWYVGDPSGLNPVPVEGMTPKFRTGSGRPKILIEF